MVAQKLQNKSPQQQLGNNFTQVCHMCDKEDALKMGKAIVDISGKNELLRAVADKDEAKVHDLILEQQGTNVNFKDYSGRTALILASMYGSSKVVQRLLAFESVDLDCQDMTGFTALMFAAQRGHQVIVEQLLNKGANHKLQDMFDNTAIILAARRNRVSCLEVLGRFATDVADWKVEGEDGLTAEEWADANGHLEAAEFIREIVAKLSTSNGAAN